MATGKKEKRANKKAEIKTNSNVGLPGQEGKSIPPNTSVGPRGSYEQWVVLLLLGGALLMMASNYGQVWGKVLLGIAIVFQVVILNRQGRFPWVVRFFTTASPITGFLL